jgi:integrase
MARPWKKKPWPRVGKRGKKSYALGFYDHERVERTRHFPSSGKAHEWMDEYNTAERRGRDSLRRFLLDLDAAEANGSDGRTIGEVIELYFALDADPELEGGLAPATFNRYQNTANCHILGHPMHNPKHEVIGRAAYAVALASLPATLFNEPHQPRKWREQMRQAGTPQPTRVQAWRVLSSVLSWAAGSHHVPEVRTNGCILANERTVTRRRSARRGGTGTAAAGRRRGSQIPSWALSPQAIEAVRDQMLMRTRERAPILAERDAAVVSLQYGTAARNQEVWGMRWMSLSESFADIVEVISWGQLNEWGKTEHSTQRRTAVPAILQEDLERWRMILRASGHPARDVDFIIPGDLGGAQFGERDPRTGAVHFTGNQAKKWGPKFFKPAVENVAKQSQFADILGATPYAMRRGGISLRLRAEDAQTVAAECGTSLQMLDAHYAFAIHDLRRFGPRPVDIEWRAARAARPGKESESAGRRTAANGMGG